MFLSPEPGEEHSRRGFAGRVLARIVLPGGIFVAGLILMAIGQIGLGASLVAIVAPLVVMTDMLARFALRSQEDREREDRARERFSRTGRWN
jgi:hypothetical protein